MGLVGIPRVEGGSSEVVALGGKEPAQAKDALKGLGAVADGRHEAASQLALTEAEIRGQGRDELTRVTEAHDCRLNRAVRRPIDHEPGRRRFEQAGHGVGIDLAVQFLARVETQLGKGDPAVTES